MSRPSTVLEVELFVDPERRRGITNELFEQLRDAVVSGRVAAGDRLPPSREVAGLLGISRHTVTTVYGRLVAEGFLEGRAGGGTYVADTDHLSGTAPRRQRSSVLRARRIPTERSGTAPPSDRGVDLRIGLPDPSLFPLVAWRRSIVSAVQSAPQGDGEPGGMADLRATLARWIGRSRGVEVNAANIVVTTGAQQAIDLICRVLLLPGDHVAMEEPGYAPVRRLFQSLGLRVSPVPVDDDGIVVDAIPPSARLVYVTPSHQSPTGAAMSLPRRRALLRLAQRLDLAIIEDDYDSEYRHADRPLEPLHRLDRSGRVMYVATFSKTLSPSLRLGFVALPDSLSASAGALSVHTGGQPPPVTQQALHRFIADGHFDRHLRKARRVYAQRHAIVTTSVDELVAAGLLRRGPVNHAGLHLGVRLPVGVEEQDVVHVARAEDVALTSTDESWLGPKAWSPLLIGFGRADERQTRRGLDVLAGVLARL